MFALAKITIIIEIMKVKNKKVLITMLKTIFITHIVIHCLSFESLNSGI